MTIPTQVSRGGESPSGAKSFSVSHVLHSGNASSARLKLVVLDVSSIGCWSLCYISALAEYS